MRKRFYGALVLGSFLLAGGVVTSCSDYDDDINNLNQRVDAVEKTLNDLKAAIEKGVTINDIATTDNGIVIKTSKGDFTIINGTSQAGCTVEIGPNGTWVINGKDTGKPSKGADGEDGKDGIIMNPMLKLIHGGKLKVIKRLTQAFHTWQKVQLPLYMIK